MNRSDNNKYYEILELTPDASLTEIKNSYQHLKKLYSSKTGVSSLFIDEISEEKRKQLLRQIEEAYNKLKEWILTERTEKEENTRYRVINNNIPEFEVFSGNALRLMREVLGVELREISLATGIPLEHLKNIELERIDQLPPQGYLKIYVSKYAEYLSLDPEKILKDYMKVFNNKKGKHNPNRF